VPADESHKILKDAFSDKAKLVAIRGGRLSG
jgi:hypothetical protein